MSLPYDGKLIEKAKYLRKNATPWEKKLWFYFLRDYPIRFQRQKVIDSYIVDFYCHEAKLVIELDGSGHYFKEQIEYDNARTLALEMHQLKILRFSNLDIDENYYNVCSVIDTEVNMRIK